MRIQLLSDLHFEFHADGGSEFVRSLDASEVEVVVLAGDIAVGPAIAGMLHAFCEHYAHGTVVYVHGNHEFYGGERRGVVELTEQVSRTRENLVWLDASVAMIQGRRFIGGPLWFPRTDAARNYRRAMTDFDQIRDLESWVYSENERMVALLESELAPGDIVVTHHLPSHRSVAPRFSGNPLNCYFVCDVEELIRERRPALWMHGHTHSSVDATIGETRLLCNPFGYVQYELNPSFRDRCIIEV